MKSLLEAFNNREIAISIWLIIFLLTLLLFSKKGVGSVSGLIVAFLNRKILSVVFSMLAYITCCVYILFVLSLWSFALLKDTILWTLGVGFFTLLKTTNRVEISFFRNVVSDAVRWTFVIEFIATLYVFSFAVEMVLTLVIIVFSILKIVAEQERKYKDVNSCLGIAITVAALIILSYSLFKTLKNYNILFTADNGKAILLVPFLTILYMPFLYLFIVAITYERLLLKLWLMSQNDRAFYRKARNAVFAAVTLNLSKLNRTAARLNKGGLHETTNLLGYFKAISRTRNTVQNL